jgi:CheY-like chemotaxis protein
MERLHISRYSAEQLYTRGRKLRRMAKSAKVDMTRQALEILASRVEKAAGRAVAEHGVIYASCPAMPAGTDFADAWQTACRHVGERYVDPATLEHPEVTGECYQLACLLVAYGMTEPLSTVTEARPTITAAIPAVSSSGQRVLVVDDVADVLVSIGAFLANAGFTVLKADNGDEAMRIIASDLSIDVLVTDFAMPGLNGADLITQAMDIRPSLKAVVITGYPNADGLAELPAGTTVLVKPFRRDALVTMVKSRLTGDVGHARPAKVLEPV